MLEFISSKAVAAIAVIALLGTVTGVFEVQKGALEEEHFKEMCRSAAQTIDGLSALNCQASVNITFRSGGAGLHLDPSFRGNPYELEFRTGQIIFRQDGLQAVCAFVRQIHLWNLSELGDGPEADAELLEKLDSGHGALRAKSGTELVAARCPLLLSGKTVYATMLSVRVIC